MDLDDKILDAYDTIGAGLLLIVTVIGFPFWFILWCLGKLAKKLGIE